MTRSLLEWVRREYPDTPKARAKQWIQTGRVSVHGVVIRRPQEVIPDPGAALQLLDRHAATLDCGPTGWRIHPRVSLLHLDPALAVVNKGPGLLAVSATADDLSAQSILADLLAGQLRAPRPIPPVYRRLKPLPVHRLDQYTTGVFCLALNPAARARLIDQLQARTMKREYIAYVQGRPKQPAGTWRHWLKASDDNLRQVVVPAGGPRAVVADAEEAVTHYEVIAELGLVTKLRLRLETGRRHQIRAQAAQAGLPLVGDRRYNPHDHGRFPRQALHAERLSLEHPVSAKPMTFTAPLPADLQRLEAALRNR